MEENIFIHTPARITKKSSQPRLPGVLKRVNNLRETANQAIIYKFVQFIREKNYRMRAENFTWNVIEVPHIVEARFITGRFSGVGFDITLPGRRRGKPSS